MTQNMKSRCLNPRLQAFMVLEKEVQDALSSAREHVQFLDAVTATWADRASPGSELLPGHVYRIRPDYKVERPYIEHSVYAPNPSNPHYMVNLGRDCCDTTLFALTGFVRFGGIVYEKDGKETLKPHIGADFGVPKRVRVYLDN